MSSGSDEPATCRSDCSAEASRTITTRTSRAIASVMRRSTSVCCWPCPSPAITAPNDSAISRWLLASSVPM